jgi:NAD(P)-dependent dehydrogenase (short-subunit alcohol dehydrogenase family)
LDLKLGGKRAIVTGGTRGIGRAIVETLLAEGAEVAFCARNADEVSATTEALSAGGKRVTGGVVDVADTAALQSWIAEATAKLGGLDVFVANVSAGGGMGPEMWQKNFDVDVMGTVRGCEAAMPALTEARGAIVIISTTAAVETFVAPQAYNALKAALVTYAKQLCEAVAPQGVRVNTVSPGPITFKGGAWETIKTHMPEFHASVLAQAPSGRFGRPEEVANAVVFLASPVASHISGVNLVVDGGFTKRVQF